MKISIIDYDLGNHSSIVNICKRINLNPIITRDKKDILNSDFIVLPGVGHFGVGIKKIMDLKLFNTLNEAVLEKKIKTLGICLGAQLMLKSSEEGNVSGLGYIDGEVLSFKREFSKFNIELPIPNMGWRYVKHQKTSDESNKQRFYFVHSYFFKLNDPREILMTSNYGFEFVCGFKKENITGFQFHPEKSHSYGMNLLKNYFERT